MPAPALLLACLLAQAAAEADHDPARAQPVPPPLPAPRPPVDGSADGPNAVGVAAPESIPQAAERLSRFLAEGAHGDMDWLSRTADRRGDPRAMWPEVRSIVLLVLNYARSGDPLAVLRQRDRGAVSVYAQSADYHDVIKPRLKRLARWLVDQGGGDAKVFVDTAAVMEILR